MQLPLYSVLWGQPRLLSLLLECARHWLLECGHLQATIYSHCKAFEEITATMSSALRSVSLAESAGGMRKALVAGVQTPESNQPLLLHCCSGYDCTCESRLAADHQVDLQCALQLTVVRHWLPADFEYNHLPAITCLSWKYVVSIEAQYL